MKHHRRLKLKKILKLLVSFISYDKNHITCFLFILEDDSFEMVPSKNKPLLLINTSNPIQHVTIIEKPVSSSIKIDEPVVNDVKQSLENSPYLPTRYGSAAIIPYDEGFDLKSLLTRRSTLPNQTNDLVNMLRNDKPKKQFIRDNSIQQLLIDNDHDRQNLVQIAKQAQQDFINAIRLDS